MTFNHELIGVFEYGIQLFKLYYKFQNGDFINESKTTYGSYYRM